MTIDAFTRAAVYTVQGIGPYEIPHPYASGAVQVSIVIDDAPVPLPGADYSVTPETSAERGDVYLSSAAAALHAGRALWIDRATPAVQIWAARTGEREVGLEAQLDRLTMAVQEIRGQLSGTARVRGDVAPFVPGEGRALIWDGAGFAAGPLASEIAAAEGYAESLKNASALALAGSPYRLPDFAALASRLRYSGATGDQINVQPGASIDVPGLGAYIVLAPGAAGARLDYTGTGGVKLAEHPESTFVTPQQFGAPGDGVSNDTGSFQAVQAAGVPVFLPAPAVSYKFSDADIIMAVPVALSPGATWASLTDSGKLKFPSQFFRDAGFVQIDRMPGRLFVGDLAQHSGNRFGENGYGTDFVSQAVASWAIKNAVLAAGAADPQGRIGVAGFAWTRPGNATAVCAGVAGIARNSGTGGTGRGGYFEVIAERSGGYDVAADLGVEIQVGNRTGITPTISPYNMGNVIVSGLKLGVDAQENYKIGDADAAAPAANARAGAAIHVSGKSTATQQFTVGAVFANNSLWRDSDGFASAVLMPQKYKIRWDASAYAEGASIWSQVDTPTKSVSLSFEDDKISFRGADHAASVAIYTGTGFVNFVGITGAVSGAACELQVYGSDANIDLRLGTKGAGVLRFGTVIASADVPITGKIQIKDASGMLRYIPVVN